MRSFWAKAAISLIILVAGVSFAHAQRGPRTARRPYMSVDSYLRALAYNPFSQTEDAAVAPENARGRRPVIRIPYRPPVRSTYQPPVQ